MQATIQDIEKNAHLPFPVSATGLGGAQAARVVQRVLEAAGSTNPDAIMAAFKALKMPLGDKDLYMIRPGGLEFAEDRMPVDSTGLIIQWQPDHSQQVVYPPAAATAEPRPMR